ncbi:MAG: SRPBCC family protein [Thiolinea sp.]
MSTVFMIILLIIVGIFFWLSTQSGKFNVSRKRTIDATPEELFAIVSDFKTWPEWTPWLAHEPGCSLAFSDQTDQEGSWYSWDGKIIGAGKMMQNVLQSPSRIDARLEFTRPMKSNSDVYWDFVPVDEGTEVTWGMKGEMPFFFRWMAAKMDGMIGKDYEIGLARLAMQAGDNSNPLELEFSGITEAPAQQYISSAWEGSLDELGPVMKEGYPKLMAAVEEHSLELSDSPFAIYHKVDPKKRFVKCEMALPVKEGKEIAGFNTGELPARRYSRTTLRGEYSHLEHAWHAAFSHLRMVKQKFKWPQPMLERYASDPQVNSGLDVVTHLDIPVK